LRNLARSNHHPTLFIAAIASLILGEAARASDRITYEIVATFGLPPCGPTTQQILNATSINNNGEVVGYYSPCVLGTPRPFYWSAATGLVIPELDPDFDDTRLYDINDAGISCGVRTLTSSGLGWEAVLFSDGRWTGLGMLPGANQSSAAAINAFGTVAGFSLNVNTGPLNAMIADVSGMTDLNALIPGEACEAFDISDRGIVAGFADFGGLALRQGFILDGKSVTLVPAFSGTINAEVVGINNDGDAIARGRAVGDEGNFVGFVRQDGKWTPLPVPDPYQYFLPRRINATGTVTGRASDARDGKAAIFRDGVSYVLDDVVLGADQMRINEANGINDDGWIVCNARLLTVPLSTPVNLVLRPVPVLLGDLNSDRNVDATDLALLLGAWGSRRVGADLDSDGVVGTADLGLLLNNWTT
jgi:uncharacterized membrane protein